MGESSAEGLAVRAGEGKRSRSPLGGEVTHIVRGEQSNGTIAVVEAVNPAGEGPPLHIHSREDEIVYVLAGDIRWKLGDQLSLTGPGSLVFIPRGVPHTWQNVGDGDCRMLITFTPAGMEGFFDRLASLTEFDPDSFRAAAAEHGMEVVGPRLAESDPL
jgi:quercetin dioxygenase-like cupin family protein